MAEPMSCERARNVLSPCLDGELSEADASAVAAHLAACTGCRREYEALSLVRSAVREHMPALAAPDVLRARISGMIRGDATAQRPGPWRGGSWSRQIAAGLLIAITSSGVTWSVMHRQRTPGVIGADDVVASHIRSLMTHHLTEVTSTDEHNVKPWFDGKVPFAPEVPRLDSIGFPLIGGRVDTITHAPAAALVYGRRKHLINVYTWPASRGAGAGDTITGITERGYNLLRWSRGDMAYAAVSDLEMVELREFVAAYTASGRSSAPSKRTIER